MNCYLDLLFAQTVPEKTHKRKLRSDPSSNHSDRKVATFFNEENTQFTERDFEDISNKIENRICKRLREAKFGQREISRLIENLSHKVDNLSSTSSEQGCLAVRTEQSENVPEEIVKNCFPNNLSCSNMVTGASATQRAHKPQRSSSLPHPNQRYPENIKIKLLQSLQTATHQNTGIPRLPKAMSTTMPTFDGKTDKFEHFEDLFQTSFKVYPNITEEERIHYPPRYSGARRSRHLEI